MVPNIRKQNKAFNKFGKDVWGNKPNAFLVGLDSGAETLKGIRQFHGSQQIHI